jgi:capsular polysaccharide transport system permease protein
VTRSRLIIPAGAVCIVLLYFLLFTPRIYTSEARIVVEKISGFDNERNLLGLIQGGASSKEVTMLKEHVLSPAMLADLDREFHLRRHYELPVDPIRSLRNNASADALLEFYRGMTAVSIDEQAGMVTVSARAFDPAMARRVLARILDRSELFLNHAASEVVAGQVAGLKEQARKSADDLEKARMELVTFQDRNRLLTPQDEAAPILAAIGRLEGDLVTKRAELQAALTYLNPESAEALKLKGQIRALQSQIGSEKARLAGGGNGLSGSAAAFEKQKMRVEFAADVYKASLVALEKAQFEAVKKSRTVIMVQPPTLPEEPSYPRPFRHVPLVLLFGYLTYLLGRLIAQVVREHQ